MLEEKQRSDNTSKTDEVALLSQLYDCMRLAAKHYTLNMQRRSDAGLHFNVIDIQIFSDQVNV